MDFSFLKNIAFLRWLFSFPLLVRYSTTLLGYVILQWISIFSMRKRWQNSRTFSESSVTKKTIAFFYFWSLSTIMIDSGIIPHPQFSTFNISASSSQFWPIVHILTYVCFSEHNSYQEFEHDDSKWQVWLASAGRFFILRSAGGETIRSVVRTQHENKITRHLSDSFLHCIIILMTVFHLHLISPTFFWLYSTCLVLAVSVAKNTLLILNYTT